MASVNDVQNRLTAIDGEIKILQSQQSGALGTDVETKRAFASAINLAGQQDGVDLAAADQTIQKQAIITQISVQEVPPVSPITQTDVDIISASVSDRFAEEKCSRLDEELTQLASRLELFVQLAKKALDSAKGDLRQTLDSKIVSEDEMRSTSGEIGRLNQQLDGRKQSRQAESASLSIAWRTSSYSSAGSMMEHGSWDDNSGVREKISKLETRHFIAQGACQRLQRSISEWERSIQQYRLALRALYGLESKCRELKSKTSELLQVLEKPQQQRGNIQEKFTGGVAPLSHAIGTSLPLVATAVA